MKMDGIDQKHDYINNNNNKKNKNKKGNNHNNNNKVSIYSI